MSGLLNALTKYGPVSLERHADQWRVGCLVKLPADLQESFIAVYSSDLPTAIKKLLETAPKERAKLWERQKTHKLY